LAFAAYSGAVRVIAIVTAVFLVSIAAASGSRRAVHAVAQRALQAPKPATAEVVCPSVGHCVAIGGSTLLVQRAAKWKAVRSPKPPSPDKGASVNLRALACPKAGRCVAAGSYGERRIVVLTQTGTKWRLSVPALPGAAGDPSFPALTSVSCAAAGACTAVGGYRFPLDTPLVVEEANGTWGDAAEPGLPANAATSPDPDHADAGGDLSLVSCPSSSGCAAVGTYTNRDARYGRYGWLLDAQTPSETSLPADAMVYGDSERGGTSPFFGFTGLSCPSAGNCTAVGGYWGRPDVQQGLILTERNGSWSQGTRAPVPAGAGPNVAGPNEFENPLQGVSCAAADDCAAIGWYVDKGKHRHGLLLTERGGRWSATRLVLPAGAPAKATVELTSVSCASRGNCVAVGWDGSHGKTHGFLVRERRGRWGRAIGAALPRNAAPARRAHTFLDSVSCPSAKVCTVVGDYADRAGTTRGLILGLRLR
jgi:hypothetical protein